MERDPSLLYRLVNLTLCFNPFSSYGEGLFLTIQSSKSYPLVKSFQFLWRGTLPHYTDQSHWLPDSLLWRKRSWCILIWSGVHWNHGISPLGSLSVECVRSVTEYQHTHSYTQQGQSHSDKCSLCNMYYKYRNMVGVPII